MEAITTLAIDINETHILFTYAGGEAELQLPATPDSVHWINGVEEKDWTDEHREVFAFLCDQYFSQFSSVECAAASALVGERIKAVVEVDGFHVAFAEADPNGAYVLQESRVRNYYNKKALYEWADDGTDIPHLIALARKTMPDLMESSHGTHD
jgi:hypothetical protein